MDFTVSRKTWYRGKGSEHSMLLRPDGTRCCIGFVAQQCGIPDSNIKGLSDVRHVEIESPSYTDLLPRWMVKASSLYIGEAYLYNDEEEITDLYREEKLSELFKRCGDTITFVD